MPRLPWSVLLRSLAVQGSWNYETLLGTGFGFVILPALRRLYPDPAALESAVHRHEGTFNSHPYLAPLALGAVIRMEADGEDPEVIDRFKAALRGSLGTLGDQFIWAAWRPLCVLVALSLLLLGVPWWVAVSIFLLTYNAGHLALMVWGLRLGLAEGRGVAERLRGSMIRRTYPRLMLAGSFMVGVALSLLIVRGVPAMEMGPGWLWVPLALLAATAGAVLGDRGRFVTTLAVGATAAVGVVLGVTS